MKKICLLLMMLFVFSGCAYNSAYKDFEKSPCACFEEGKKEIKNDA